MICPNCNRKIPEESTLCPKCKTNIGDKLSPFQKYDIIMQKRLSGWMFFLITLIVTGIAASVCLGTLGGIINTGILSLMVNCIITFIAIITVVGLWNAWLNAKNGVVKIGEQSEKILRLSGFLSIVAWVIGIGGIIIGLMRIFFDSDTTDKAIDFIRSVLNNVVVEYIFDIIDEGTIINVIGVVAAVYGICFVFISKHIVLKKIMESIGDGYANKRVPNCKFLFVFYAIVSGICGILFFCVACIVISNIWNIIKIFQIFQYFPFISIILMIFASVICCTPSLIYVFLSILFAVSTNEVHECYIEQQKEIL